MKKQTSQTKRFNRSKNENAITLVALIITIIILIILAAVTINSLTHDGLVDLAIKASQDYNKQSQNEMEMLNEIDNMIKDMFTEGEGGNIQTPEDTIEGVTLKLEGEANGSIAKVIASVAKATAGVKSYKFEYKLSTDTDYKLGAELDNTELICEYTYTSLASGKENNLKLTVTDNKGNTEEAFLNLTTANKWNNNDITEENVGGESVPIPDGATIIDPVDNVDKGVVIKDSKDNEWVWVPVDTVTYNSMFAEDSSGIALAGSTGVKTTKYSTSASIIGQTQIIPGSGSGFQEPDLITGTSYDQANYSKAGFNSLNNMATKLVSEYEIMLDSIKKYGGFYIGRYELTANGSKAGEPLSNQTWYQLYKTCKELTIDENKGISRMIWRMPVGCNMFVAKKFWI